ncbi:MAG: hypothetical protein H7Y33_08830 [Cytophagales bacterium]|nr:hypothetical protein [Rhizobacter sp.]
MKFVSHCLFALLWAATLATAQAQVTRQPPSFTPLPPGINPLDPKLTPIQRDELRRFDIVNKLDFLDQDVAKRVCLPSPPTSAADIDVHRSLFVHDRATLEARDFSLKRTMDQLASQVSGLAPGTTGASIFRQFWDAQNPAALALTTGARCSDNAGSLNGFPHACRPRGPEEGGEAEGSDAAINTRMNGTLGAPQSWLPLAIVNRIDLAHEGWRNCGEFRLVYGQQILAGLGGVGSRNLIIFEGVLPNPTPGCRSGCRPVMQMWKSLSAMASPTDRAAKLEEFFYTGLPGFRPVVHVDHYSAKGVTGTYGASGSGQIRTNQFRAISPGSRWMLKEFKTVLDCGSSPCKFELTPIPPKLTPWGELWNEDVANSPAHPLQPLAQAFQNNTAAQTSLLGNPALMRFGYAVSLPHNAPQSFSQAPVTSVSETSPSSQGPFAVWTDQYLTQLNSAVGSVNVFRSNLVAGAAVHGLTAAQLTNRAVAQSCAGCHHPRNFGLLAPNSIGPSTTPSGAIVTSWPDSLSTTTSFVHVETFPSPLPELSSSAFPSNQGHALSPALNDVFLPDRRNFLVNQLNAINCPCTHRFSPLSASAREAAIPRQEALLDSFVPQATQWQNLLSERLAKSRSLPLEEALKLDTQRAAISAQQERALSKLRMELNLPSTTISQRPQPLTLEATRQAAGRLELERELRQKEVLGILAQEPERRTTTGSFRSH